MKQKVNIVTVNYNSGEDTIACIRSIQKSTYKNYQVFIVDNFSNDDSLEKLGQACIRMEVSYVFVNAEDLNDKSEVRDAISSKEIVIIRSTQNNGFASGNNIALKFLLNNRQDEFVWLLNPDTEIENTVMEDLIDISYKKQKIITGNLIHFYDNPKDIMYCGGFKVKKLAHGITSIKNYENLKKIDAIAGASLFTPLTTFKDIGLLPEQYFMYWEETDFCTRAKRRGYKFEVNCKSIIYDHVERTTKNSFLKEYLYLLNGLRFYKKYYPFNLPIIFVTSLFKLLKASLRKNKIKKRAILFGIIDFLRIVTGQKINIKNRINSQLDNIEIQ